MRENNRFGKYVANNSTSRRFEMNLNLRNLRRSMELNLNPRPKERKTEDASTLCQTGLRPPFLLRRDMPAQHAIDLGLIAAVRGMLLEPGQHIGVESDRHGLL